MLACKREVVWPLRFRHVSFGLGTLLLTACALLVSCGGGGGGHVVTSERNTLVALYNSTNGDHWYHNKYWRYSPGEVDPDWSPERDGFNDNGTECGWYGVTCRSVHVIALDLSNNNLVGKLPPLNALTQLERVDVSGNPGLDVSSWASGGAPNSSVVFIH